MSRKPEEDVDVYDSVDYKPNLYGLRMKLRVSEKTWNVNWKEGHRNVA